MLHQYQIYDLAAAMQADRLARARVCWLVCTGRNGQLNIIDRTWIALQGLLHPAKRTPRKTTALTGAAAK